MSNRWPPPPSWLGPAWDTFAALDPELEQAYHYSDYPGDMAGEGNWTDLYLDQSNIVGRLWVSPENGATGFLPVDNGNLTYATKAVLELREMFHHGVEALVAYDFIKSQFYCGEEQTGDLKQAKEGTVDGAAA